MSYKNLRGPTKISYHTSQDNKILRVQKAVLYHIEFDKRGSLTFVSKPYSKSRVLGT